MNNASSQLLGSLGRVHSVETLGAADGPGVRFVVFLQGCPMRCAFCHNPDTWSAAGGKEMSVGELLEKFNQKRVFYRNGGITVSGGEPLMQAPFVADLFEAAHNDPKGRIHTCLDTSGYIADFDQVQQNGKGEKPPLSDDSALSRLLQNTDLVLLDIKHSNSEGFKDLTGREQISTRRFLSQLQEMKVPTLVRHVVVPGITDGEEELTDLGKLMANYSNIVGFELLPYHTMGTKKYEELKLPYRLKGVPNLDMSTLPELTSIVANAYKASKSSKARNESKRSDKSMARETRKETQETKANKS